MYLLFDAVNSMVQDVFGLGGTPLKLMRVGIALVLLYFLLRGLMYFNRRNWSVLILSEAVAV